METEFSVAVRRLQRAQSMPAIQHFTDSEENNIYLDVKCNSSFGVSTKTTHRTLSLNSRASKNEIESVIDEDPDKVKIESVVNEDLAKANRQTPMSTKAATSAAEEMGLDQERNSIDGEYTFTELLSQHADTEMPGVPEQGMSIERWLNLGNLIRNDVDSLVEDEQSTQFMYEQGPLIESDCGVCFEMVNEHSRACCQQMVCNTCMVEYLNHKILDGSVHLLCPAHDCTKPVSRDEIICRVKDQTVLEKYHRFLTNANLDPSKKTCPHCCLISEQPTQPCSKYGRPIICGQCEFHWCFDCHSPSHQDVKCKDNVKGLKALKAWTKGDSNGQRNARKCPSCKLLIQRSSGCDHMKCTQCKADFCYKCGGKLLRARFLFGNHYNRFSILGCPHNFMDGKRKHLRRVIRGSIFSGKLVGATVASAVLIGLLPIAATAAVFVGPVIGFVRLHKYLRTKKARKTHLSRQSTHGSDGESIFDSQIMEEMLRTLERDLDALRNMHHDTRALSVSSTRFPSSSTLSGATSRIADKDEITSL